MKRASSTGNLFGSLLLGSASTHTSTQLKPHGADKLRTSDTTAATTDTKDSLASGRRSRTARPTGGGKEAPSRVRSKSNTRLGLPRRNNTVDGSTFKDSVVSVMSNLNLDSTQHSPTNDEKLMSDIFKTATELEDLAKAARKARRRKGPLRRAKSCMGPDVTDILGPSLAAAADTMDEDDASIKSHKSHSSLKGLMSPLFTKSPGRSRSRENSEAPNTTGGRRRNRSITRLISRVRGKEEPEIPQVPTELEIPAVPRPMESTSSRRRHRKKRSSSKKMENPYAPTYYHDSDDDDDSLILGEDEKLNDYERQVKAEVKNMTIVINLPSSQCA